MLKSIIKNRFFHIMVISVVGVIAYSNSFDVPFYFDDYPRIVNNPLLKEIDNYIPPVGSRDVGYLSFAINYYFGELNVSAYHLANLLIHIFNAILIFWLLLLTLKTPYFRGLQEDSADRTSVSYIAFITSLLFVSHPIQTQAVTYIVQRFTSLTTLFFLLSVISYIKSRLTVRANVRLILYGLTLFFAVLAMHTKQIAFTLPLVIIIFELVFFEGNIRNRAFYLIPIVMTVFIIPLRLVDMSGSLDEIIERADTASRVDLEGFAFSRSEYFLTQFRVIITYLRLLLWPVDQTLDYDYPLYRTLFDWQVMISFITLSVLFGAGIYLLLRSQPSKDKSLLPVDTSDSNSYFYRLIAFGIFWFFITLSVESSIIPIVHIIFEHRMYLPSVGILLSLSSLVMLIGHRWEKAFRPIVAAVALAVIALTVATFNRNAVWKNEIAFWQDGVRKAMLRVAPHYHLGMAYFRAGHYREAVESFRLASTLSSDYAETYFMMGESFYRMKWFKDAIASYEIAATKDSTNPRIYNQLGNAFYQSGKLNEAARSYQNAILLDPNYAEAYQNLDMILKMMRPLSDPK